MYRPIFANKGDYFLLNMILYHLKEKKVRLTHYKHCCIQFLSSFGGSVKLVLSCGENMRILFVR